MKRILLIDDDRASLSLLRELFKSQGWHAETAQTPERALELASREKFDLLFGRESDGSITVRQRRFKLSFSLPR